MALPPFSGNAVHLVDPDTGAPYSSTSKGYTLASGVTLAPGSAGSAASPTAGSATATAAGLQRNLDARLDLVGTFASGASLTLEYLAADQLTWRTSMSGITTSGSYPDPAVSTLKIAANASVRLRNVGTAAITNLSATVG